MRHVQTRDQILHIFETSMRNPTAFFDNFFALYEGMLGDPKWERSVRRILASSGEERIRIKMERELQRIAEHSGTSPNPSAECVSNGVREIVGR